MANLLHSWVLHLGPAAAKIVWLQHSEFKNKVHPQHLSSLFQAANTQKTFLYDGGIKAFIDQVSKRVRLLLDSTACDDTILCSHILTHTGLFCLYRTAVPAVTETRTCCMQMFAHSINFFISNIHVLSTECFCDVHSAVWVTDFAITQFRLELRFVLSCCVSMLYCSKVIKKQILQLLEIISARPDCGLSAELQTWYFCDLCVSS